MLKKFMVENYMNFKEKIEIDFEKVGGYQFNFSCITNSLISKMLIYGRNATGKTNFVNAIADITLSNIYFLFGIGNRYENSNFLNADSDVDYANFTYLFRFGEDEISYNYSKYSPTSYKSERLELNNKCVFDFSYDKGEFNQSNLELISAETIMKDRFLQSINKDDVSDESETSLCFLRWLFANAAFAAGSPMYEMRDFISKMRVVRFGYAVTIRNHKDTFLNLLEKKEELDKFESFLNDMGVECTLKVKILPDGSNQLYFKHKKLIPFFETASSGTLALYNFYRRFVINMQNMRFCLFDEFDAFFHYEMSERFLQYCKQNYPDCQMIFATHNTNLMNNHLMRPDCLFILSRDGRLTPLNLATTRELREGHNLEKMYKSGEFEKYE